LINLPSGINYRRAPRIRIMGLSLFLLYSFLHGYHNSHGFLPGGGLLTRYPLRRYDSRRRLSQGGKPGKSPRACLLRYFKFCWNCRSSARLLFSRSCSTTFLKAGSPC